ncbi:MAG: hypothetical protein C4523_01225 [Myxococcales bacterium]|nr:MAG: hypothetical protein C4523_01225 [Myxococcales bacterium]
MKKMILLAAAVALMGLGFAGCGENPCEPVYKDYHVWKVPPKDMDGAKQVLGKFVTEDCSGVHVEWVWKTPQDEGLACRQYTGTKQLNTILGKAVGDTVESAIKDIAGVDTNEDQDNYSRMAAEVVEECGVQRSALALKTDPEVCEEGSDRADDFEPWWFVRRVYRMSWRNSIKEMKAEDMAKIAAKAGEIEALLPGLKLDVSEEAQAKGIMVMDWQDVWAAYRHEEIAEGRCFHYAPFSKKAE